MNHLRKLATKESSLYPVSASLPLKKSIKRYSEDTKQLNVRAVSLFNTIDYTLPVARVNDGDVQMDMHPCECGETPSSLNKNGSPELVENNATASHGADETTPYWVSRKNPEVRAFQKFYTIQINNINVGEENYQRPGPNVFLNSMRYNLTVTCSGSSRGSFLRWGFLYDKYSYGKTVYSQEELFQTVQSQGPDQIEEVTHASSFRNVDELHTLLILKDETINFGTNASVNQSLPPQSITTQHPAGSYYEDKSLSLEPLVTHYFTGTSTGTQADIANGNLLIWFYPYETLNPGVTLTFTFLIRLYFSSGDDSLTSWRALTYLSNPSLVNIMSSIKSKQRIGQTQEMDVNNTLELRCMAYQIVNSTSQADEFFGIEHKVANGLCYTKGSLISELKYVDFVAYARNFAYRVDQPGTNASLVYLINQIYPGLNAVQRINSRVRLMQIQYRVLINKGYALVGVPQQTIIPLVFTFALVYDRSPQYNANTLLNATPSVDDIFSGVDLEGRKAASPFKTQQYSNRFVILKQKNVFLDINDDVSGVYLSPANIFFKGTLKLFQRDNHTAPFVNAAEQGHFRSTKEAASTLEQGFVTEFNPGLYVDGQLTPSLITYGAVYVVAKSQLLDKNYPVQNQGVNISTRIWYYD